MNSVDVDQCYLQCWLRWNEGSNTHFLQLWLWLIITVTCWLN